MRALLRIALALAICSTPSWTARAGTSDAATKALATAAFERQRLSSPAGRLALVTAAANYCDDLGHSYPRNSPSEEAWLNTEMAGGNDRAMRASESPEFGRTLAANFVDTCVQAANSYRGNGDKRRALVSMALAFSRFRDDAKYYAVKNGVDYDTFGLEVIPHVALEALLVAALQE